MSVTFRPAVAGDLPAMIALLADDPLGASRETVADPLPDSYRQAFETIHGDPCHTLLLAVDGDCILAMLQLSYLPHLTHRGGWRAQIEGVRVAADRRGTGIGRRLIEHALSLAAGRGCRMVQLTTDRRRPDAIRFYEACGFTASHVGLKRGLEQL